jgi:hypothetical protein
MAKSREEVLNSLRNIFKPDDKAVVAAATATKSPAEGAFRSKFKRRLAEVAEEQEEEEQEEEEIEDASEIEEESEVEEQEEVTDVDVSPVEELLDRVESLIDYIGEHHAALKSWITAAR